MNEMMNSAPVRLQPRGEENDVKTNLFLFVAALAAVSCAAARGASFAMAEADCSANLEACQAKCRAAPTDEMCDVLKVRRAEELAAKSGSPGEIDPSVIPLDRDMERLCHFGISRACRAREALRPSVAAASSRQQQDKDDRLGAQKNAASAAQRTKAMKTRTEEMEKEAHEILTVLRRDEFGCTPHGNTCERALRPAKDAAELARSARNCLQTHQIETASGDCLDRFDRAEKQLQIAKDEHKTIESEMRAEQEAREARRKEDEETDAAFKSCQADPPGCQRECAGNAAATVCLALSGLYSIGDERITKGGANFAKSREVARKACDAGNQGGCRIVVMLEKKAASCSSADSCKEYCDGAFEEACALLGQMYATGTDDVRKDAVKAVTYFRKGCDGGSPGACNGLGSAYFDGIGLMRDRVTAQGFFKRACDGFQKKIDSTTKPGTEPHPMLVTQRNEACQNEAGTACVNKVQVPAQRRPALDEQCRRRALPRTAWATLNGTDQDECMNAMMNRGCTEAMGLQAYCCPRDN